MREIPLTKGYTAVVDDEDYERVSRRKWCASVTHRKDGSIKGVYAQRRVSLGGGGSAIQLLHRFIAGITDSKVQVDHVDHDGLNNRRENLRAATNTQNSRNSRLSANNTSGFKGVTWEKSRGLWQAQIYIAGRNYVLGHFASAQLAAVAYDTAACDHFGEFALTNQELRAEEAL